MWTSCAAIVAASTIFLTPVFAGEWQPIGPVGGNVQSIAAVDDSGGEKILLAGGRNGLLFQQRGHATNWSQLSFGTPVFGTVKTLAIDPGNHRHYWAGVAGENIADSGLWESDDSGAHWRRVPDLSGLAIESFAVWRKDPKIALAGTRRGLYRTANGKDWSRLSPPGNPELQDITAVAFATNTASVIYAGTPHLPWKSTDGGAHWRPARTGMLDDSDVFSLYVDPARPQLVFASACSGIYRSENGGAAWKLLDGIPGTSRRTHVIVQDPRRPPVMYAGTTMGLFKSWNGGVKWNRLNDLQVNSIAFDNADSRVVYLATEHSGVMVSRDGGETLAAMNTGLMSRNVAAVAGSAGAFPARLYVSTAYEGAQGGVFRAFLNNASNTALSTNWQRIGAAADFGGRNVTMLAAGANETFAATGDRVYRKMETVGRETAGKATTAWTALPANRSEVRALHVLKEGTLLAATGSGLMRMAKGATQWENLPLNGMMMPVMAMHVASFADSNFILVQTSTGVFASSDGGKHWRPWRIPASAGALYSIAGGCENVLWMATSRGLFQATLTANNANIDPELVPASGIPEGTISAVAVHPLHCQTAYATQFGKTYVSHNAANAAESGANWTLLTEGTGRDIQQLLLFRVNPDELFASVAGQGLFVQNIYPLGAVARTF